MLEKKVAKIGHSHYVLLDSYFVKVLRLATGSRVNVEIKNGSLVITPQRDKK